MSTAFAVDTDYIDTIKKNSNLFFRIIYRKLKTLKNTVFQRFIVPVFSIIGVEFMLKVQPLFHRGYKTPKNLHIFIQFILG